MKDKKKIQIFYGGFKFIKGGVNSNSNTLKEELQKNFDVSLYTLDNLPLLVRFFPHAIEKVVNFFFLPLGFFYKDICTSFLFKFFLIKKLIIEFSKIFICHGILVFRLQPYFMRYGVIICKNIL